jgi:hypothetical protein
MPPSPSPSSRPRPFARRLSQWICGLHGHDTRLEIRADRLALHCVHCNYDSPGWQVGGPSPLTVRAADETAMAPSSTPASASAR